MMWNMAFLMKSAGLGITVQPGYVLVGTLYRIYRCVSVVVVVMFHRGLKCKGRRRNACLLLSIGRRLFPDWVTLSNQQARILDWVTVPRQLGDIRIPVKFPNSPASISSSRMGGKIEVLVVCSQRGSLLLKQSRAGWPESSAPRREVTMYPPPTPRHPSHR
jgi:hypothetical protein